MRSFFAIAATLLFSASAHAELPPVTASFRDAKLLRLDRVLGAYPWRHGAEVTALGFSSDGARLATAGGDRRLKIWRRDGEEVRSLGPAKGRTNHVGFTPDGTPFSTSSNGNVVLWDPSTGAATTTFAHGASISAYAFTPDGARLVSAGRDRIVKIWDVRTGQLLATTSFAVQANGGPPPPAFSAVAASTTRAIIAFADGGVIELELTTGTPGRGITRGLTVDASGFSGDRRWLVSAAAGALHLFDVAAGTDRIIARDIDPISALAVSGDGATALLGSRDGHIALWDLRRGVRRFEAVAHTAELTDVAITPDGKIGATASRDYTFRLWDLATGTPLPHTDGRPIYAAAFVHDDQLATSGADGFIRLWARDGSDTSVLGRHPTAVYALVALGTQLVTGGDDGTLRFWKVAGGSAPKSVRAHSGGVLALAASSDGKRLLSGGGDERIRLWDIRKQRGQGELRMAAPVAAVAFAPDGKRGAAGDDSGLIRLFDVPGLRPYGRLAGHRGLVLGLRFAGDGNVFASASEDNTARLWTAKGKPIGQFEEHGSAVTAITFLPNGRWVSADKDGLLIVRDGHGKPLETLDLGPSGDFALALAVSPDGGQLAVATARGVILLFLISI